MPESNKTNNIQVGGGVSLGKGASHLLSAQKQANAIQGQATAIENPVKAMQDKATAAIQDKLNFAKGMDPNKFLRDQVNAMKSIIAKQALNKIPASLLQAIGISFLFALASFANGIVYYSTSVINIPENTLAEILQGEDNCTGLGLDETECNTKIKCFLKKCGHFDRPKKKKKEDTSVQMGGYSLSKNSKKKRKRKTKKKNNKVKSSSNNFESKLTALHIVNEYFKNRIHKEVLKYKKIIKKRRNKQLRKRTNKSSNPRRKRFTNKKKIQIGGGQDWGTGHGDHIDDSYGSNIPNISSPNSEGDNGINMDPPLSPFTNSDNRTNKDNNDTLYFGKNEEENEEYALLMKSFFKSDDFTYNDIYKMLIVIYLLKTFFENEENKRKIKEQFKTYDITKIGNKKRFYKSELNDYELIYPWASAKTIQSEMKPPMARTMCLYEHLTKTEQDEPMKKMCCAGKNCMTTIKSASIIWKKFIDSIFKGDLSFQIRDAIKIIHERLRDKYVDRKTKTGNKIYYLTLLALDKDNIKDKQKVKQLIEKSFEENINKIDVSEFESDEKEEKKEENNRKRLNEYRDMYEKFRGTGLVYSDESVSTDDNDIIDIYIEKLKKELYGEEEKEKDDKNPKNNETTESSNTNTNTNAKQLQTGGNLFDYFSKKDENKLHQQNDKEDNENNFKNMQRIALQTYKTFFRLDHRGVTSKLQDYELTQEEEEDLKTLKSFDINKDENRLKEFLKKLPGALPYGVV